MKKLLVTMLAAVLLLSLAGGLMADDMWPEGTYNTKVPTPKEILGYDLGEIHTPHYMIERYLEAIAKASDRVLLTSYGKTYQGRKLFHVVISSPENLAKLDEIKANNRKLTAVDGSVSAADLQEIIANNPAIAMLNYNIHGGEASGLEAALRTVYQLAAGTDEATLKVLGNVVVVIDPVQNPDGHDRFVSYVNGYSIGDKTDANPGSFVHSEPWPGSRVNAYYFDMNRDWYLTTQIETQQRLKAVLDWLPQVAPDLHEMGTNSTYYFAPPMKPHNPLLPEIQHKWWAIYGRSNADMFDKFGVQYFTKESFDYFYPGYGGSMPTYYGAIAMTYEQASVRARLTTRDDGTKLALKDAVWHHFLTSMATVITTAEVREARLTDFHQYFVDVAERFKTDKIKEFYITPGDPARFNKLVSKLQLLGGVVKKAKEEFTVKGAYNFFTRQTESVKLPAGTAIVSLDQMAGNALRSVLQPDTALDKEFLKEEVDRQRRNLSSRFYDITAWAFPLTYNLQAYYSDSNTSVAADPFATITSWKAETKEVESTKVAYLIPPDTNANITLLSKLFAADYKLRVARLEFKLAGRTYPPGTAVIWVKRNKDSLHADLNKFIKESGGYAVAAKTGMVESGIDLGSNNVMNLKNPKIALLGDTPFSSNGFGAVRYLFEQVYDVPYISFRSFNFNRIKLEDFNVIVLPNSRGASGIKQVLGKGGVAKLKDWVNEGGVLVALGGSVDFLGDEEVGLSSAPKYKQTRKEAGEVENPYADKPVKKEESKEEKKAENGNGKDKEKKYEVEKLLSVPGAILRARLDDRSFISWGYDDLTVPVLVSGRGVYEPISDDQGTAAVRYYAEEEMVIAGHIWPESKELLPGKAYMWHQRQGSGMVICFSQDVTFRASYDGLDRMFFNALYFASAFTR